MSELVFLGGRPVALGLGDGDVGDLLAYRQAWEPFIAGHLELWRHINEILERTQIARDVCPKGIFNPDQIRGNPAEAALCADLLLSRIMTDPTSPGGILHRWNQWKDRTSSEIVSGAKLMLETHQNTVTWVGGPAKNDLVRIAALWKIPVQLPDLPPFSLQEQIIARIEGAFLATKGVLSLFGYAAGDMLVEASDAAVAGAKDLKDTASRVVDRATSPVLWIGVALAVAVVGGVLVVYYVPRRQKTVSGPALPA